jgi:hypothetical protein
MHPVVGYLSGYWLGSPPTARILRDVQMVHFGDHCPGDNVARSGVLVGQVGSTVPTVSVDGADQGGAVFAGSSCFTSVKTADAHRLDGDLRAFDEDRRVRAVPR